MQRNGGYVRDKSGNATEVVLCTLKLLCQGLKNASVKSHHRQVRKTWRRTSLTHWNRCASEPPMYYFFAQMFHLTRKLRYARRSRRFNNTYQKGLTGKQAAWATKKYRGHRVLPDSILVELEEAKIWHFGTDLFLTIIHYIISHIHCHSYRTYFNSILYTVQTHNTTS